MRKFSSRRLPPTLPGLMRYLASARAQCGIPRAADARCSGSRRSIGTVTPMSASLPAISGTAAAASSLLTVTRTSCEPRCASALDLQRRSGGVGSVGVRHRLDDDGMGGPNGDATDQDRGRLSSSYCRHFRLREMIFKANSLAMALHSKHALPFPAFWSTNV